MAVVTAELQSKEKIDVETCMYDDPHDMSTSQIKGCLNGILFDPAWQRKLGATDREQLNIVVLAEKAKKFKFLQGYTKWRTTGTWRKVSPTGEVIEEYPDEKNLQMEIEFRDRPDEKVGERIIELFNEYNKREVKEELLYTYTQPIEESSL